MRHLLRAALAALLLLAPALLPAPAFAVTCTKDSGDITTANTCVETATVNKGAVAINVEGSFTGTIALKVTGNSTLVPLSVRPAGGGAEVTSITGTGLWFASIGGAVKVQAISTAGLTGTATVTINTSDSNNGAGSGAIASPLGVTCTSPCDVQFAAGVSIALQSSAMMDGTTQVTPKFASISLAGNGNNTVVAANATKKIRVLQYCFVTDAAVNAKFQSGAGGTDLTGLMVWDAASKGMCPSYSPVGLFQTLATNTLLNLSLSGAVGVRGFIIYIEVD